MLLWTVDAFAVAAVAFLVLDIAFTSGGFLA
jgi:hypothetical protein